MKLLLCTECLDIVKLLWRERRCSCGRSCGTVAENGTGHFTGPALPLEAPDVGIKSAITQKPSPNCPTRICFYIVPADEVALDPEDRWVNKKKRRYKVAAKKKRLPKHAKPYARRRSCDRAKKP